MLARGSASRCIGHWAGGRRRKNGFLVPGVRESAESKERVPPPRGLTASAMKSGQGVFLREVSRRLAYTHLEAEHRLVNGALNDLVEGISHTPRCFQQSVIRRHSHRSTLWWINASLRTLRMLRKSCQSGS